TTATASIAATAGQTASQTETYKYGGLYTALLTLSDSSAARPWLAGAVTQTIQQKFLTNVTGTPRAFTFGVGTNTTSLTVGHGVNVTTTSITYATGYATSRQSTSFVYTFFWGDGQTSTVTTGKIATASHTYTTPGPSPSFNYTIRVVAQENSG